MLYCILCVSDDLTVLSGRRWVLIWISCFFFFFSSLLPCLWCWQCYSTIRQRFVHVFHQLHLCMFVSHRHCFCQVVYTPAGVRKRYSPKTNQAWCCSPGEKKIPGEQQLWKSRQIYFTHHEPFTNSTDYSFQALVFLWLTPHTDNLPSYPGLGLVTSDSAKQSFFTGQVTAHRRVLAHVTVKAPNSY